MRTDLAMTPPTVCGHPPNLSLLSLNKLSPPSSLPRPPRCLTPYSGRTFSPSTSPLSTSRPLVLDMEIEIEAEDNGASATRSQGLTLEDKALPEGERDGQIVKPTHRAVPINLRMSSISPNSPEFPYPPYSPISPTDATSPSSATFQPLVPPRAHPIFPISPNPRSIPLSPSAKHYLLTRRDRRPEPIYIPLSHSSRRESGSIGAKSAGTVRARKVRISPKQPFTAPGPIYLGLGGSVPLPRTPKTPKTALGTNWSMQAMRTAMPLTARRVGVAHS